LFTTKVRNDGAASAPHASIVILAQRMIVAYAAFCPLAFVEARVEAARKRIDAGVNGFAGSALIRNVHRRPHAVIVIKFDDMLQQLLRQDRDQRARAPTLVVIGDFLDVGMLGIELRLQLCFRCRP